MLESGTHVLCSLLPAGPVSHLLLAVRLVLQHRVYALLDDIANIIGLKANLKAERS